MTNTIVFIHGAWVTERCWDQMKAWFEQQGYTCLAPAWPERRPGLGVVEIVDHYERLIRALPEPPILIGHSFGGLFVQMLLDRGVGACGIAIDSAPPRGILPWKYPSIVKAFWGVLTTPFGWKKIVQFKRRSFAYGFVHTLPKAEQDQIYDQFVVAETGRIFFQSAFAMFNPATTVNFKNPKRAPLLLVAGELDKVTPAGINRINFKKYAGNGTRTDFKEFPGRTHWLIAGKGWEELAEDMRGWLQQL